MATGRTPAAAVPEALAFGPARPDRWAEVRHFLMPAIERTGEHREAEVIAELEQGLAQLWIGEGVGGVRCAVVTCLSRNARGLTCEIWLTGGEGHHDWIHLIERIEAAARERGCRSIELTGRIGWVRLLPHYRRKAVILERIL